MLKGLEYSSQSERRIRTNLHDERISFLSCCCFVRELRRQFLKDAVDERGGGVYFSFYFDCKPTRLILFFFCFQNSSIKFFSSELGCLVSVSRLIICFICRKTIAVGGCLFYWRYLELCHKCCGCENSAGVISKIHFHVCKPNIYLFCQVRKQRCTLCDFLDSFWVLAGM